MLEVDRDASVSSVRESHLAREFEVLDDRRARWRGRTEDAFLRLAPGVFYIDLRRGFKRLLN